MSPSVNDSVEVLQGRFADHDLTQVLQAVTVGKRVAIDQLPGLGEVIRGVEAELGADGRVVVRYSGTEAKLRVMLEGPDLGRLEDYAGRIGDAARRELGGA